MKVLRKPEEVFEYGLVLITGLGFLFFNISTNYWRNSWYDRWALIVSVFSVVFSLWIGRKLSWMLAPVTCVMLLSAASIAVWPQNQFVRMIPPEAFASLGKNALYAYLTIVIVCLTIVKLPIRFKGAVTMYLGLIPILSAIATLTKLLHPVVERGAFSGNPSMNGCLIAALLPFTWELNRQLRYVLLAVCVTAIAATGSSIALGVLGVVAVTYTITSNRVSNRSLLLGCLGMFGMLALRANFGKHDLFSDSGRFVVWQAVMKYWYEHFSMWFGTGIGSGVVIIPWIQDQTRSSYGGWFLWMHCEPIQILIESGMIGLSACILAVIRILTITDKTPYFAPLAGFMAMSLFNYPLRLPIHATALVLIVWLILKGGENTHGKETS